MTRDERMSLLLTCVDFYATNKQGDYGRRANAVLAKIADDERQEGMKKEREKEKERGTE
jgi:hypothetical protein